MAEFYATLKSLWVVWLIMIFVGIVVWAYWPKRKAEMDDHAKIPFREDDEKRK
ncbi:MAG: cbb3-type cytochrome c oxidase subunit 3 [Alphaproteobacteria bacterium]|jgi:cytochrome c oxidase cbb3-type subunit 4